MKPNTATKTLVFLAALVVAFAGLMILTDNSDAATFYVPDDHAALQDAINAADSGDTIQINTTTLTPAETIWVNTTQLTIQGNGTANTIIDGGTNSLTKVLNVTAENVTIKDLAVNGSTQDGIYFETATGTYAGTPNNCTVTDVYIHNNSQHGVYVAAGQNCTLVNSTIEYNGGDTDNYGGLYLTADQRWAIVGNLFKANTQNAIYSTENSDDDTSVFLYNMFRNNTDFAIESPGGTIRADHNCWYNETAGSWGGVPDASGVDNISTSVTADIYYNGTITDAGVSLTSDGTATYATTIPYTEITYHEQGRQYNHWLAAAEFSTLPIGSPSGRYTPYPLYGAFNLSGTDTNNPGIGSDEWLNISVKYDFASWPSGISQSDGVVSGLWHYNWTTWTEVTGTYMVDGVNTTNTGDYEGYVYGNFTSNPTSPVLAMLNDLDASFDYSPTELDVGETVTFDASNSSNLEGEISTYHWNFDNGGGNLDAVGTTVSHSFDTEGLYDVKLTIEDYTGKTDSVTHTVNVTTTEPGVGVTPGEGSYTLTVMVYGDGSALNDATVTLKAGGVQVATATTNSNGQATFTSVEGTYTVTADKQGYDSMTQYVTVDSDTQITLALGTIGVAEQPVLFGLGLPLLLLGIMALIGLAAVVYTATKDDEMWNISMGWNLLFLVVTAMLWLFTTWLTDVQALILGFLFAVFVLLTYVAGKDEIERWMNRRRSRW